MKKVIILALVMLVTVMSYGQRSEYNRVAIGIETGIHSVSDQSAVVTDNFNHFGLNVRYNINELFGVGLSGGFDNINVRTLTFDNVDLNYGRVNLEATISVFELLRLRHKYINFLVHGGPGVAFINTDNGYSENPMNVAGGITGLLKLSRSMSLKVDYTSSVHLSQDRTLDGEFDINNAGINSVVDNLSAGLVFYIGRKDDDGNKRQHADWYVAPKPEPIVPVINNITQFTEVREVTKEVLVKEPFREYVFFEHDKFDVTFKSDLVKQPQNPLYKTKVYMDENQFAVLLVTAFASDTKSSNKYNLELSKKRAENVKAKLVDMGVPANRIKIDYRGKDFDYSESTVHDMARRVELSIE